MPLPIQNARISKLIHEAYNVVGRFRARVDETVVPVCLVDDFSAGGGFPVVRRAASFALEGAVAAEFPVFRFETPPGVLCVIRKIWGRPVTSPQFLNIFFGSQIAAPANVAAKSYIDGRVRARGETPAGVLVSDSAAALPITHLRYITSNISLEPLEVEWPIGMLGSFDFIEFESGGVNQAYLFSLEWDEHLIRP